MTNGITGNIIVFGVEFPVLEFLLILNIIMLFYIVISMFELRSLIKLRKDLELLIRGGKPLEKPKVENKKEEVTKKETFFGKT